MRLRNSISKTGICADFIITHIEIDFMLYSSTIFKYSAQMQISNIIQFLLTSRFDDVNTSQEYLDV